jgi:hypothetical protein
MSSSANARWRPTQSTNAALTRRSASRVDRSGLLVAELLSPDQIAERARASDRSPPGAWSRLQRRAPGAARGATAANASSRPPKRTRRQRRECLPGGAAGRLTTAVRTPSRATRFPSSTARSERPEIVPWDRTRSDLRTAAARGHTSCTSPTLPHPRAAHEPRTGDSKASHAARCGQPRTQAPVR